MKSLTRRETLQGLGVIGVGTLLSACGGSGNGDAAATPTLAPSATSLPPSSPTRTASAAATSTATAAQTTPTAVSTQAPTTTPGPSDSPTPAASATGTATSAATDTATPLATDTATPTPSEPPIDTATATPTGTPVAQCILSPEQTEGPFFLDVGLLRSDIRETREGARLRLALLLVQVDGCTPIKDAVVNLWHADAAGLYSGFSGQLGGVDTTGQTFLRGYQVTGADGRVEFVTIYPGWYPGRTVHMHLKIHLDSTTLLTSQLYFPDSFTDAVYTQAPYSSRGQRNTTNANDGIILSGGATLDEVVLQVAAESGGYAASMVIGVG